MALILAILFAIAAPDPPPLPVDAPVVAPDPTLKIRTYEVEFIEINTAGTHLTQHIFWDTDTVYLDVTNKANGRHSLIKTRVIINRGWRIVPHDDLLNGISDDNGYFQDQWLGCDGVLYRVRAETLVESITEFDVEMLNRRRLRNQICP